MQVAGNAREFALDLFLLDDGFDLVDRRRARVPNGLSVIVAEILNQRVQTRIGHVREMRRGVAGIDHGHAFALDQRDGYARFFQKIGRGYAGNAGAHDQNIHPKLAVQRRKSFDRRGIDPIGNFFSSHSLRTPTLV